jgi:hypothetical protein
MCHYIPLLASTGHTLSDFNYIQSNIFLVKYFLKGQLQDFGG